MRTNLAGERESVRAQTKQYAAKTAQSLKNQLPTTRAPTPPVQAKPRPKPVPKFKPAPKKSSLPATAYAPNDILSESAESSSGLDIESFPFPWLSDKNTSKKRTFTDRDSLSGPETSHAAPAWAVAASAPSSPIYISSTSPEPRPLQRPTSSSSNLRRWPQDFYVCDIDACFAECKKKRANSRDEGISSSSDSDSGSESDTTSDQDSERSVKELFAQFFGRDTMYVKSTFYDVRRRYQNMKARHRAEVRAALSAGYEEGGLWKAFILTVSKQAKQRKHSSRR